MHRRRDRLHHAQAVAVRLAAIALALAAVGVVRADVQKIGKDGTVHRNDVQPFAVGQTVGTVLVHTRQWASGGHDATNVPGTDDVAIDRDPALEVDPNTGNLLLVWSRNDGSGFSLYFSKYDGTSWSPPRRLVRSTSDVSDPQIRFNATGTVLHVVWSQQDGSGANSFYRLTFDATTYAAVYGPERLPTDDTGTDSTPMTSNRYFCGFQSGRVSGDSGRLFLWGVRDEPVPITCHQTFLLPPCARAAAQMDVEWLAGKLTLWMYDGAGRLYYSVRLDAGWTPVRVVEVTSLTSASDARLLLNDLNARGSQ